MDRRVFLKFISLFPILSSSYVFSKGHMKRTVFYSILELKNNPPKYIGEIIFLKSYHQGMDLGGGFFVARYKDDMTTDEGKYIETNSEFFWERVLDYNCRNTKKPEWYGCIGDGITDDSVAFSQMLYHLDDGDLIVLRNNATYYNGVNERKYEWTINKKRISIIGNNAILVRRPTLSSILDDNLSTLKIMGDNFTIEGNLTITTNEKEMPLVDKKNRIISTDKYPRGAVSSHGLFFENVKNITILDKIICSGAVFPCYVAGCKNINIKGVFNNSGQVYPVKGTDLQLGSGIKLSNCEKFNLDIITDKSAYCGCEIEPNCRNGIVKVTASNPFMHGCILHKKIEFVDIDIRTVGAIKGAAMRISSGCTDISGEIYSDRCQNALVIMSDRINICKKLDIIVSSKNTLKRIITISNDNKKFPSLESSKIKIKNIDGNNNLGKDQIFYASKIYNSSFLINSKKGIIEIIDSSDIEVNIDLQNNKKDIKIINVNNKNLRVL
ncbi:hypothetical protein VSX61_02740 [Brenneria populi subsp. brevivirga]|uniref:hypothetical protein n=1 Tax=Brenneria populi TaxID=1505588 RepID=UPI002E17AFFC|nr:hypothetical protein [Brenneria populi subsp. brevivirga]